MEIKNIKIKDLKFAEYNPRKLNDEQYNQIKISLEKFGFVDPIIVNSNKDRFNTIIGGHMRTCVWKDFGNKEVPVFYLDLSLENERELNIRLNKNSGEWDFEKLVNEFKIPELLEWGFDENEFNFDDNYKIDNDENKIKLIDKFIIPPFSILDTRQGYWNERKRNWKKLINDNGETREGVLSEKTNLMGNINDGTSIFDPVLAEIIIKWFSFENSNIFDCFSGGSFGFVASHLGHEFKGVEIRKEQCLLNNKRIDNYKKSEYICDDGQNILNHIKENTQDLLFSCPPYFNLEIYSDLEKDASNQKEYSDFLNILDVAFSNSIKCLKNNRFAVIVVGDIRNKKGFYYNFISDIKNIFIKNNMLLYNELILVESLGTAKLRVKRAMKNRKIIKTHQNILVFYKGDTKEIKNIYPELEIEINDNLSEGF